ncbi:MAG: S8 family peptidase [Acidimicrobiales bacterium]
MRTGAAAAMVAAAVFVGIPFAAASAPSAATAAGAFVHSMPAGRYVVTDRSGLSKGAAGAVHGVGGRVVEVLAQADSVVARLSAHQASLLAGQGQLALSADVTITPQGQYMSGATPAAVYPQQTQATQLWTQGDTGSGVNVAVLDTGIDPLPDFAGRLIGGVDLSGEGNPLHDSYGHGTFVAGLIAGNGASSNGQYVGEAPGADLVSIKVAGATGQTSLSLLTQGIDWAIQNKSAYQIGVLNISFGYQPTESTVNDPVDIAVENAWKAGIVVVTSAGNEGPYSGTITAPGDDPLAITVGALNDLGQTDPTKDTVPPFTSVGPTDPDGWFKPDLAASGTSVVSEAAPGSTVYEQNPGAMIGTSNFVGSGTSFSAAVTSGAAALLLSAHPGLIPDKVKASMLMSTLTGPVGDPFVDGHGDLDVAAASALSNSVQLKEPQTGSGVAMGATVQLAQTWQQSTWNPAMCPSTACQNLEAAQAAGTGSVLASTPGVGPAGEAWNGMTWNGGSWNGGSWNGGSWNGETFNGMTWNGGSWNGGSWNGGSWNGGVWNGGSWNGGSWNGGSWNGGSWNGGSWNGGSWNGGSWNGGSWNGDTWS